MLFSNYLFNLRPGVLIKTVSHIWGKLNLPTLLLRVGLLTLINMDSLIYLHKCLGPHKPVTIPRQAIPLTIPLGRQVIPLGETVLSLSQIAMFPRWHLPRKQGLPPPNRHNSPQHSSPLEKPNPKWVINLSSKPLTKAQRSVLAKGPNFAVSPKHPPNLEYITAIEAACTKLSQQDAEELRADVNQVLEPLNPQT